MNEEIKQFLKSLKSDMFGSRDTTKEAIDYAHQLIESITSKDRIAAYTAMYVLLNSVSDEIMRELFPLETKPN
jgi:DNA-binding GntR family transcriptional regulator